jgi:hypothetical protein
MKRLVFPVVAVLVLASAAVSSGSFRAGLVTKAQASTATPIAFGPTTVVDDQRVAGEPGVKVCGPSATWSLGNCGASNPYATAPWGFSTTSSFIWRSEDKGRSYKLVPSNSLTGKPDACPGGGDSDIAVSPGPNQNQDYLNFADLQALTNFSTGVSPDGGTSFTCNPGTTEATPVDRQWFGVYRNPAGPLLLPRSNGSTVYLDYDVAAGVTPTCLLGSNSNGNAFVVQTSMDGGSVWNPYVTVDCNDGIAGNVQVNQSTGHVFAIHSAYSSLSQTFTDRVTVNRSVDFGATWTAATVFDCSGKCVVGNDFAVLAIDKSGGLYATWSQAPADSSGNITGPSHIYYAYSANDGTAWTKEQQVDTGATDVNVFAWIVAGNAGAIDVVWYGTKAGTSGIYDSGQQTTDWFPYMAQSVDANSASAHFTSPVAVSQHPHHNGGICTMGIGCTTGGDRSLADFFQVDINQAGAAVVTWADTSNNGNQGDNQGALIDAATQIAGPTLYGTTLTGSLAICRAVTSTPCQSDPTGDAKFEAGGVIGPNTPKLDITGSSINIDPNNHNRLLVRLNVSNLASLPTAADLFPGSGTVVDYLTSWNYHVPGHTQADFDSTGNVYYAYLEVNTANGAVTAFDGNTCSLATTHPKYLVYPGQNTIQSRVDRENGVIDLFVPLSDVGNPPVGATLYSVTAHTVSQQFAAGPSNCPRVSGSNDDASGQIFNVYDKSAAYTSILTIPVPPTGCHEGDGRGDVRGKNGGNAQFQSDEDSCEDSDQDGEQMNDPGADENFQSTQIEAKQFDDSTGTMTISGIGLANGLPVTFVIVEKAATALTPAIYTIQLSDGYVNTGPLLSGSITLK